MAPPVRGSLRLGTRLTKNTTSTDADATAQGNRYDWAMIDPGLPASRLTALRAANPVIFVLAHDKSMSNQTNSSTEFSGSQYYLDKTSGLKVQTNNYWLLAISQAAVRTNRIDRAVGYMNAYSADGVFIDVSGPGRLRERTWHDSAGKVADFGGDDAPGGNWPTWQKALHEQMQTGLGSGKTLMWNGFGNYSTSQVTFWTDTQAYMAALTGSQDESWMFPGANPRSETNWLLFLTRIQTYVNQGKYFSMGAASGATDLNYPATQIRRFNLGSYLLIADGTYALLRIGVSTGDVNTYEAAIHDVDYGTPDPAVNGGVYQVFGTAGTNAIYKRTFTKYRVWVNPGSGERTQDGKTLAKYTALLEARSDPPAVPGAPSISLGTTTTTQIPATISAGTPAGTTYELQYRRDIDGWGASPQITGLPTGLYNIGSGGEGPLESARLYYVRPYARNATGLSAAGTQQSATTQAVVLAPPTGFVLVNPTLNSLTAQWNAVAGATSYKIQYRNQGDGWPGSPQLTGLTGTSYVITGLTAGVKEAQILTTNAAGDGAWSSTATGTVPAPPTVPADPSSPTIVAVDYDTVRCGCTDNSTNEDGFKWRVNRQDTGGGVFTQIGTTTAGVVTLDYTDPAPGIGGHVYQMEVAAYNGVGDSAYARSGTVTTPEQNPTPPITFPGSSTFPGGPGFPGSPTFPS